MLFLYILSLISIILQVVFITISIAAGLYYLAELVEEYSVVAKKVISWLIIITTFIHIGLMIFEDLPFWMNVLGLLAQGIHSLLIRDFPVVKITSITFLASVLLLVGNHYYAFQYFGKNYHNFSEVLAYFTLCLWIVPFALFVSLSANDNVLPTHGEHQPLLNNESVVGFLSRKQKKYGLLSLFGYFKENLLPQRLKKSF